MGFFNSQTKMKTYLSGLFICLVSALLIACGGGSSTGGAFPVMPIPESPLLPPISEAPETEAPNCTVALWGDSVMYGGYEIFKRLEVPPASNLQLMLPQYRINDYSFNGASAFHSLVSFLGNPLNEEVIVIEYGINDGNMGLPYEQSLRSMIEYSKAKNKTVVITGVLKNPELNQVAEDLAIEYGVLFADWPSVEYQEGDTPDGTHPNQEYSTRLVQRLAEVISLGVPECTPQE